MSIYFLLRHLTTEECKGGGTMISYASTTAESDDDAIRYFCEKYSVNPESLSTDIGKNKEYSVFKLCLPVPA